MRGEYLLFNLVVISMPVLLTVIWPRKFRMRWGMAAVATVVGAVPFLVWDLLAAGRHWTYSERLTLGGDGLPPGEWAFFLSVPLACLFTWETLFAPSQTEEPPSGRRALVWLGTMFVGVGTAVFVGSGLEYTGLALIAPGVVALADAGLDVRLARYRRFPAFMLTVVVLTVVFNGYLTARPIVLYDESFQLGVRVGTVPIEDFGFGLALAYSVTLVYEWVGGRGAVPSLTARIIERRLGGFRHRYETPDGSLPSAVHREVRVAVIGAGIAGLRAATVLAERGVHVTVIERNAYIGGKLGAWPTRLADGSTAYLEHGFHAFFGHYYNLDAFLTELGATETLRLIEDYVILTKDGRKHGFGDLPAAPGLNLVGMLGTPLLRLKDVMHPDSRKLESLLAYDPDATYAAFGDVTFAEFMDAAHVSAALRLVFNSFSRAFFSEPDEMCAADVIRSFHFYYLSHDKGLRYRYPTVTHEHAVLAPIRARLRSAGATVRLETEVARIDPVAGGGHLVDGEAFDHVVLACDVAGARRILDASPALLEMDPVLRAALPVLVPSGRYAVLRLYLDRDTPRELPGFVITDRGPGAALDSVSLYHRLEEESAAWARRHAGGVFELHAYRLPDALVDDGQVRDRLISDFHEFFPELADATILDEFLQVRADFTAHHVGMHRCRPGVETDVQGFSLAADWVALPQPALLMEAACTAGLLAANRILRSVGARTEPVDGVPPRGLLATRAGA